MTSEFLDVPRLSPRAPRAREIAWRPWGEEAFEEARRRDVPVLLAISAVWCHWCHVMDETSYSDPAVIALINERYVAVRVDADRRPDINTRYNMGGWPTTAMLTPRGVVLSGATFVQPASMRALLERVAEFYATQRDRIEAHLGDLERLAADMNAQEALPADEVTSASELDPAVAAEIIASILERYDSDHGGFGTAPKFPQAAILQLLLTTWRTARYEEGRAQRREIRSGVVASPEVFAEAAERFTAIVMKTLGGMIGGGLYDTAAGGFYRYATQADWSQPHLEKIAGDQAALMRVLAGACMLTDDDGLHEVLEKTWSWVRETLYAAPTHNFYGSQDADGAGVDRTSYSNLTSALAAAAFPVADALEDDEIGVLAVRTLDALDAEMRDEDGLLYHYREEDDVPRVRRLFRDQVAYAGALLDAHEWSGEPRFLERAVALVAAIDVVFGAHATGYADHAHGGRIGALARQDRVLDENASAADMLLRLGVLTRVESYGAAATRLLAVFASQARAAGPGAASYAQALARAMTTSTSVVIVGDPRSAADLRRAARELGDPYVCVRSVAPDDDEALAQFGLTPSRAPLAYVCRERRCAPPAADAQALQRIFATFV